MKVISFTISAALSILCFGTKLAAHEEINWSEVFVCPIQENAIILEDTTLHTPSVQCQYLLSFRLSWKILMEKGVKMSVCYKKTI
jgi:hypothetical protein